MKNPAINQMNKPKVTVELILDGVDVIANTILNNITNTIQYPNERHGILIIYSSIYIFFKNNLVQLCVYNF
jgi:hypothetical protein